MSRFLTVALLASATTLAALPQPAHPAPYAHRTMPPRTRAPERPNIVVILVDDLGWPDVSSYGRTEVRTPNIDRIAKSGVAFTDGYVAASVCAVSRAGLLTGRRPMEFGFTYNINDRGDVAPNIGLPLNEKTIGDRLKAFGYGTAIFGKWHQGSGPSFYPTRRGFDEFFGFVAGETVYVDPKTPGIVTTPTKADHYAIDQRTGGGVVVEGPNATPVNDFGKYLTNEITDRAVDYIQRSARERRPFLAYVAYNAPHWPLQVPQTYYDRFASIKDPVRRTYVAMISALDDGVGHILDTLDRQGIRDNTMVFFLSDNGCPVQFGFCTVDHPWGAGKFTYLEGGTRVPFLLSWPAGLKKRGLVHTPVSSLDILPTALHAAAPSKPLPAGLDGEDLLHLLSRPDAAPRTLLWGQDPVFAVREGRYKLWRSRDWNKTYLYDLDADPAEMKDLSDGQPQIRDRLARKLEAWRGSLPTPIWPLRSTRHITINGRDTEWVY